MEKHRIIVVKVGTSSLTDTSGRLSQEKLTRVTDQISKLVKDGCIGCSSCYTTCPDVAITVVR